MFFISLFVSRTKKNWLKISGSLKVSDVPFSSFARCSARDAQLEILSGSDGRHKPVHIPWVCGVSQVAPGVADRTRSTAILGERAQRHWGDPAVMVHGLCRPVG